MYGIKEFFSDKKSWIVIAIFLLCFFLIPVFVSMAKWDKHTKGIVCNKHDNKCVLKEYSNAHSICFDLILNNDLGTDERCELPRIVVSTTGIFDLDEISGTSISYESPYKIIKLKDKGGEVIEVMRYRDSVKANTEKSKFDKQLELWKKHYDVSDKMSDKNEYWYIFRAD